MAGGASRPTAVPSERLSKSLGRYYRYRSQAFPPCSCRCREQCMASHDAGPYNEPCRPDAPSCVVRCSPLAALELTLEVEQASPPALTCIPTGSYNMITGLVLLHACARVRASRENCLHGWHSRQSPDTAPLQTLSTTLTKGLGGTIPSATALGSAGRARPCSGKSAAAFVGACCRRVERCIRACRRRRRQSLRPGAGGAPCVPGCHSKPHRISKANVCFGESAKASGNKTAHVQTQLEVWAHAEGSAGAGEGAPGTGQAEHQMPLR